MNNKAQLEDRLYQSVCVVQQTRLNLHMDGIHNLLQTLLCVISTNAMSHAHAHGDIEAAETIIELIKDQKKSDDLYKKHALMLNEIMDVLKEQLKGTRHDHPIL